MNIKLSHIITVSTCLFYSYNSFSQEKPNIVFILADDMGYGDVSVNNPYSRVNTPAIDRLAKQGIRFTEAHSAGSVSTPSRYALLTGRYFFRTPKQQGHWGYLPPYIESERETIGTLLQKSGYTTASIGKWHLGLNWQKKNENLAIIPDPKSQRHTNVDFSLPVSGGPNDLGFDYSFIMPASLDMPPYMFIRNNSVIDPEIVLTADVYPNRLDETIDAWDRKHTSDDDIYWERGVWWRNGEMSKSFKVERCLDYIVEEGIAFIEREGKKDKPFFLYLPLTGPHTPWVANKQFKGTTELGAYGDFIAQIDDVIAQINKKIVELGIEKNTMIVFTSDNGAAWEKDDIIQYAHQSSWGRKGMKGDAWDGGHHVPLIIKWPKTIKPGTTYNHDISLVDFYATFSELTNQNIKENVAEDSFSFMKILLGKQINETRNHIVYLSSSGNLAIKKGDWKYIEGIGSGGFTYPSRLETVKNGPTGQLYNMKEDVLECNNLFLEKPEIVDTLDCLLEKIVRNEYRE